MMNMHLFLFTIMMMKAFCLPTMEDYHEIYLDTCQTSCNALNNNHEGDNCRDKFCPTYVKYLLDGYHTAPDSHILVSTNDHAVNEFCAGWLLELMEKFGWEHRVRLQLKQCRCAASKSCRL